MFQDIVEAVNAYEQRFGQETSAANENTHPTNQNWS
jgi:hypothetical protein